MYIELTYAVELAHDYAPAQFRDDVAAGFTQMSGPPNAGQVQSAESISYARVPGKTSLYQLFVRLDGDAIGASLGGLGRVWSLLFGNPFRHSGITAVCLTRIQPSSGLAAQLGGPSVGRDGITDSAARDAGPLLAVPLPLALELPDASELVRDLVKAGVNIVCDSPLHSSDVSGLRQRIDRYAAVAESLDQPFLYFANGTLRLDVLLPCIEYLEEYEHPRLTVGLRLCPLSVGLNVVSYCAARAIPVYGFNMVDIGQGPRGWSVGALTTAFRLAGCDLITMGLLAPDVMEAPDTIDMVDAATASEPEIAPALPVFTGGITPRVAHAVIRRYGNDVGLHTKRPILRGGFGYRALSQNVGAIREAATLGPVETATDVMRAEARNSRKWRAYEERYPD